MMSAARNQFEEAFARLCETPFPPGSENCEAVDDLHAELAEYDGHVAGVATSVLGGAPVDQQWLTPDHGLKERLRLEAVGLDPECQALARQYLDYLALLNDVLEMSRCGMNRV